MERQRKSYYEFGPFRFDTEERTLQQGGCPVSLPPKVAETLFLLLKNAGRLVEKDKLIEMVWPGAFVEEGNLNKNIFKLRKTLGQWDGGREYIETVPKRGYRFVASVKWEEYEETISPKQIRTLSREPRVLQWMTSRANRTKALLLAFILAVAVAWTVLYRPGQLTSPTTAAIHSVAVLPFENLSGDPAQDYFAEGMTDELITDLGQIAPLRVVSRTSVMQYRGAHKPLPQIARELNVDAIVEGAVLRSEGKVRITVQLIQAALDKHLWAQTYEGKLQDVLVMQNDIAGAIAKQVRGVLVRQEEVRAGVKRPVNLEAYEAYLKGEYLLNKFTAESIFTAINHFQQAIEKDPNYAPAYTKLAGCYQILTNMGAIPKKIAIPKTKLLVAKALEIDPEFGAAHAMRGWTLLLYDLDFATAGAEFRRAVALNPNSIEAHEGLGNYYASIGQLEDSVQQIQYARELDPLGLIVNFDLCQTLYFAKRFDEALAQCKANLDLDPNSVRAFVNVAKVYSAKGMEPEATSTYIHTLEMMGAPSDMISAVKKGARQSGLSGYWSALVPFIQENVSNGTIDSWDAAIGYTYSGDSDKALMSLKKAIEARHYGITYLSVDPTFDRLRADRRFILLLGSIHLPATQG